MKQLAIIAATIAISVTSTSVFASAKVVNVCGGGAAGTYNKIAVDIAELMNNSSAMKKYGIIAQIPQEEFEKEMRPEYRGSISNMDGAVDGDCDIFVTQPDALNWYRNEYPSETSGFQVMASAGTEYVLPFCNKKVGNDLDILEDLDNPVVAVVEGSGDYAFFKNLAVDDDGYADVKMIYAANSYDAAELVSKGQAACSVAITSFDSVDVIDIISAFNRKLVFAEASDGDFYDATYEVDGDKVKLYTKFPVSKEQLRGIERSDTFGSQDVLSMQRQIAINDTMYDRFTNKESRSLRRVIKSAVEAASSNY